jgi:hypothetical protein
MMGGGAQENDMWLTQERKLAIREPAYARSPEKHLFSSDWERLLGSSG